MQVDTTVPEIGSLLDFGPWGAYQKRTIALTAGVVVFDGLDIQMTGYAVPAIARDWGLHPAIFASVLAAGLFGVAIGSALGGFIGDRLGRRWAIIASAFSFAFCTLGMAFTHDLTSLLVLRFLAGFGIGGALPNAATLASEFTPLNRRPLATTLTIICIPLGGVVAGTLASLLSGHSWRMLFVVAGALPLLYAAVMLFALPESPRYLAKDPANAQRLRLLLARMGHAASELSHRAQSSLDDHSQSAGVRQLFAGPQRRDTLALWCAFFFCLLTVYLAFNWLPSTLLSYHLDNKEAILGLTLYNFGGIFGAVLVGWWISLRGSRFPMSLSSGVGILSAVCLAILVAGPRTSHGLLLAVVCINGLAVNAVQTTLYALATHIYTTGIRATGTALALAMGRIGAIISAFFGARLLGMHSGSYFIALALTMTAVLIAIQVIRNHVTAGSV